MNLPLLSGIILGKTMPPISALGKTMLLMPLFLVLFWTKIGPVLGGFVQSYASSLCKTLG
jgi:hypothetical protein